MGKAIRGRARRKKREACNRSDGRRREDERVGSVQANQYD